MGTLRSRLPSLLLVLTLLLGACIAAKDYYDLLSVPKGASESQIKRAYRKLALQYHPDKVTGSTAEKEAAAKKFAEISSAYDVLSSEETRNIYDRYGEDGVKQHAAQGSGGGGSPQDIFSQFFGGGGGPFGGFGFGFGGGQDEEEQIPKGNDVRLGLEVTLRDLYLGNTFKVTRNKNVIKPAKGKRQCRCKNKMVTRQLGPGMYQQYTTQECEECDNVKFERERETLEVKVEPGMMDGQEVVFFEEGEPIVDGESGDLKFMIRTERHPHFRREGNHLHYGMAIKLVDALVGYDLELEHLDGHKVRLKTGGVTKPGEVRIIEGEGMPLFEGGKRRGDLSVTHTILFPKSLTEAEKATAKGLLTDKVHDEL